MYETYQTHMDPLNKAHKTCFSWFLTIWLNPHEFWQSNTGKLPKIPPYKSNWPQFLPGLLKQLHKQFFKQLYLIHPEVFCYFIIVDISIRLNPCESKRIFTTIWLNPQKPCGPLGYMTKMWILAHGMCMEKITHEVCTVVLMHIFRSYDLTGTPGPLISA